MSNGRHIRTNHSAPGPRKQERTDITIETGPVTAGIISDLYSNDMGITGDDVNFFPGDSGWMHLPHQSVMSDRNKGVNTANADVQGVPAFSDTLQIATFSVGDPI